MDRIKGRYDRFQMLYGGEATRPANTYPFFGSLCRCFVGRKINGAGYGDNIITESAEAPMTFGGGGSYRGYSFWYDVHDLYLNFFPSAVNTPDGPKLLEV